MTSIHDKWKFRWIESRKPKIQPKPASDEVLSADINILNLSMRSYHALMRGKLDTVDKVIKNWENVPKLNGIGKSSTSDIRTKIISYLTENKRINELARFM